MRSLQIHQAASSLPIVVTLDQFLQDLPQQTSNLENSLEGDSQTSAINPFILKSALEFDLEDCLQRVEELLGQPVRPGALKQGLTNFALGMYPARANAEFSLASRC